MGTANWSLAFYGRYGGNAGTGHVLSSAHTSSGSTTTSTTATDITTNARAGCILRINPTEAMWLNTTGTAAAGTGHYLAANETFVCAIDRDSTVSVIDAA